MFQRLSISSTILILLLLIISCTETNQKNIRPQIVCTTGMIADAVQNICGNWADVTSLMGAGVDPHLYKASQGDTEKLSNADLIVYNGLHLEGKMEAGTKKNFDMLRGRILRLEALINGILQYSRAGRVKNELSDIDMNLFLPDIIQNLAPPENFRIHYSKNLPHVIAEKISLEQVFSNFISNAVKYNSNPKPEITIEAEEKDSHYYFSVADNGPGIEPEFHQKIFVIFQTLQARDVVESTGVGLAIVKKIVEEQGGTVWVESEKGKGAKFCFTLPKQEVSKIVELI